MPFYVYNLIRLPRAFLAASLLSQSSELWASQHPQLITFPSRAGTLAKRYETGTHGSSR